MISREEMDQVDMSDIVTDQIIGPVTPGEVLLEEFIKPLGLSARGLARDLQVPPNRITAILRGERAITAETAILLGRRLRTSAEFWMNLQTAHDLERARIGGRRNLASYPATSS